MKQTKEKSKNLNILKRLWKMIFRKPTVQELMKEFGCGL